LPRKSYFAKTASFHIIDRVIKTAIPMEHQVSFKLVLLQLVIDQLKVRQKFLAFVLLNSNAFSGVK